MVGREGLEWDGSEREILEPEGLKGLLLVLAEPKKHLN
jgi:hypothetical protein